MMDAIWRDLYYRPGNSNMTTADFNINLTLCGLVTPYNGIGSGYGLLPEPMLTQEYPVECTFAENSQDMLAKLSLKIIL